jgi:hypothetical protein
LVVREFDRVAARDERAERAAGLELGELAVIADQHQLAIGAFDVFEQPGELARGDHPRLVDDQHDAVRQRIAAAHEPGEQRRDAGAGDPGAGLELARGAPRDRHAEHRVAGGLPRLARHAQRKRLARAGLACHDADQLAIAAEPLDHPTLLVRERPARRDRGRDVVGLRDADGSAGAGHRVVDQTLLERDQLPGSSSAAARA